MSCHLEERLREAAALGDLEEVRALLRQGVEVNAQNEINGWTCLHWACKRNHTQIVAYLLDSGADKGIFTVNKELAAHLTSKKEIKKLLGVEEYDNQESDAKLSSITDYLTNETFPCAHNQERGSVCHTSAPAKDAYTAFPHLSAGEPSPCISAIPAGTVCTAISLPKETRLLGENLWDEDLTSLTTGVPECTKSQELVLKVRVQNPKENDFIEIEVDRKNLTYQDLLRVCCCELGIKSEQVEKIRKLPNTLLRKDKDVARLQDFQELELVLVRSIGSPFRNAATITLKERSCYNTKAAKLTY